MLSNHRMIAGKVVKAWEIEKYKVDNNSINHFDKRTYTHSIDAIKMIDFYFSKTTNLLWKYKIILYLIGNTPKTFEQSLKFQKERNEVLNEMKGVIILSRINKN